jgi:5-methylcytosine-specific restriction endonuclease McrA
MLTRENYYKNLDRERARGRLYGKSKRDGTYINKGHPKLTEAERKARDVRFAHIRRARIAAVGGTYTPADIALLMTEQDGKCALCFQLLGADIHVDHWMPISLGGTNDPSNLQLTHPRCNMIKGAAHPHTLTLPLSG